MPPRSASSDGSPGSPRARSVVRVTPPGTRPTPVILVLGAEYRQAMVDQGKSLLRITPTRWGTVSTGGFPPEVAERSCDAHLDDARLVRLEKIALSRIGASTLNCDGEHV